MIDTYSKPMMMQHNPRLMKENSWQRQHDLMVKMDEYQKCSECHDKISAKDEVEQLYTILQCMHMIHKKCLKLMAEKYANFTNDDYL